jgi:hypothetical protein
MLIDVKNLRSQLGYLIITVAELWLFNLYTQPDDGFILKPKHVADFLISKYTVVFDGLILVLL